MTHFADVLVQVQHPSLHQSRVSLFTFLKTVLRDSSVNFCFEWKENGAACNYLNANRTLEKNYSNWDFVTFSNREMTKHVNYYQFKIDYSGVHDVYE
jgi:hypothetical protein